MPTLERLLETPHEVVGVVTQPDKPSGRGRKLTAPPVKRLAEAHGLRVLQPESVKTEGFAEELRGLSADVAVVVAYGKILPKRVLDAPRHGCLNIHGSLLPAYRGAAPIQWAVINGEAKTGVTIMRMDEGMDTGPMIATQEVDILEDDDAISLGNVLSLMGAKLMIEVLETLERDGVLAEREQDHSKATKAPLIKREMAEIDWSKDFEKTICAIRGFQPWPKAYTFLKDTEIKIVGAEACDPAWVPQSAFDARVSPGTVVEVLKGRGFVVRAGGERGLVLVTRVQPAGKAEMGAFDFVNGGGVDVGSCFGRR